MKSFLGLIKTKLLLIRKNIYRKIYTSPKYNRDIINSFHKLYYNSHETLKIFEGSTWLGVPIKKCPLDCWIYQEIIFKLKPDIIIECGTSWGGSALYFASLCDLIHKGRIITTDIIDRKGKPKHKRIKYLIGSSISEDIIRKIKHTITKKNKVLVILDSDHSKDHVSKELNIYSKLVTKGSYLIVEDTNINGNPVCPGSGPGPMEAVKEFLNKNQEYCVDKNKEKYYMTYNPHGFLKRVA